MGGVMNSMGVAVHSAEDLACLTTVECFKASDLNNDGKLSIEEFKTWFFAEDNDPSFLFSPMRLKHELIACFLTTTSVLSIFPMRTSCMNQGNLCKGILLPAFKPLHSPL